MALLPLPYAGKTVWYALTGLFDQQSILKRRDKKGDPLVRLNSVVNWNIFLPAIEAALTKNRKSAAGRKAFEPLLMFRILILQSLYGMVDDDAEDIRFLAVSSG